MGRHSTVEERAAYIRRRLSTAFDEEAALVALSPADTATLRLIEKDYTFLPGDVDTLRSRIASAHIEAVRARVQLSTRHVKAPIVRWWAQTVLAEFLPGHTDHDDRVGGQYVIRLVEERSNGPDVYEVTTLLNADPRRFYVDVHVEEIE